MKKSFLIFFMLLLFSVASVSSTKVLDIISNSTLYGVDSQKYHGDIQGSDDGLIFDGVDDWINVTDNSYIQFGNDKNYSISFLINLSYVTGSDHVINNGALDVNSGWNIQVSAIPALRFKSNSINSENFDTPIEYDRMYHAVFVNNRNNISLFLDGVFISNYTVTGGNDSSLVNYFGIGGTYTGTANFNGTLNDILIYNRSLSQSEILQLNNSQEVTDGLVYSSAMTELSDLTGNGNNGQEFGNITYTNDTPEDKDWIEGSFEFDGVDDYIDINESINYSNGFSSFVWVKALNSTEGGTNTVMAKDLGNVNSNYRVWRILLSRDGTLMYTRLWNEAGTNSDEYCRDIDVNNEWNQVGITYNNTHRVMYLNGEICNISTTISGAVRDSPIPIRLGYDYYDTEPFNHLNGSISNVQIFNTSLSDTEVRSLYETGSEQFDLVLNMTFDKVTGVSNQTYYGDIQGTDDGMIFDGVDDNIIINTDENPQLISPTSWCAEWKGYGEVEKIISKFDRYSDRYYILDEKNEHLRCIHYSDGASLLTESTKNINDNITHKGCCVLNGTGLQLFIDGELDGFSEGAYTDLIYNTNYLSIGARYRLPNASVDSFFNGTISGINLYNRTLSSSEILQLNNSEEVTDGLVYYNDMKSLSDSSVSNTHGQEFGNITLTNDTYYINSSKNAFEFDGVDDSIKIGDGETFDNINTTGITLSLWVYNNEVENNDRLFDIEGRTYMDFDNLNYRFRIYTDTYFQVNTSSVIAKQWDNIVATCDGTTISIYRNGILEDSTISNSCGSIDEVDRYSAIGSEWNGDSFNFNGSIDDVLIYNRALSDVEIYNMYINSIAPLPANTCSYSGVGNWNVNCADGCNITSNVNMLNNNLIINGTGTFKLLNANIYNINNIYVTGIDTLNTCNIYSYGGEFFGN